MTWSNRFWAAALVFNAATNEWIVGRVMIERGQAPWFTILGGLFLLAITSAFLWRGAKP